MKITSKNHPLAKWKRRALLVDTEELSTKRFFRAYSKRNFRLRIRRNAQKSHPHSLTASFLGNLVGSFLNVIDARDLCLVSTAAYKTYHCYFIGAATWRVGHKLFHKTQFIRSISIYAEDKFPNNYMWPPRLNELRCNDVLRELPTTLTTLTLNIEQLTNLQNLKLPTTTTTLKIDILFCPWENLQIPKCPTVNTLHIVSNLANIYRLGVESSFPNLRSLMLNLRSFSYIPLRMRWPPQLRCLHLRNLNADIISPLSATLQVLEILGKIRNCENFPKSLQILYISHPDRFENTFPTLQIKQITSTLQHCEVCGIVVHKT